VVHEHQLYDIIKECHFVLGHMKSERTYFHLVKTYSNITEGMCKFYIKVCHSCNKTTHPKKTKLVVAQMPIKSFEFCDRWQWDLVDMTNDPKHLILFDLSTRIMHYILHGQDHFSDLHYLRAMAQLQQRLLLKLDMKLIMLMLYLVFQPYFILTMVVNL
jgi:hypothetical protein